MIKMSVKNIAQPIGPILKTDIKKRSLSSQQKYHPEQYVFPTVSWHPSPERGFTAPLTLCAGATHCVLGWGSSSFTHIQMPVKNE